MEIPSAGSLRFPGEGSSSQGKSISKLRPEGVGDGKTVNIPLPPVMLIFQGTQEDRSAAYWIAVPVRGTVPASLRATEDKVIDFTLTRKA